MNHLNFEDVFPIENGGYVIAMLVYWTVDTYVHDSQCIYRVYIYIRRVFYLKINMYHVLNESQLSIIIDSK